MQSQIELKLLPPLKPLSAQSISMQRLLLGAIATLSAVVGDANFLAAQAASLTNWSFDPAANQLEITVKDGTTPRYFLMAQPARIVVDLPGTAIGDVSVQKTYAGVVRQIRVSQFEPGLTRIVMEISPGVSLAPGQVRLQKVGDRATQAGNSRWVLQPLVTSSLSVNAVTVQPAAVQPTRPASSSASSTKPPTAAASVAPASLHTSSPQQTQPPAIANNLPSPPPTASLAPTALPPQAESSNSTPTVSVGATSKSPVDSTMTAAPTTPVALAPVLPAVPIQSTGTVTPLPPNVVTPIDPNVGIDTSGGVAIAIPSPTPAPATTVSHPATLPPAAATKAPPATTSSRLAPTATQVSMARPDSPVAADIPLSLAAQPSTVAPSVSVPPLSDQGSSDQEAVPALRTNSSVIAPQSEAPLEALPALPGGSPTQASVSVPPLIRVGTPNLGTVNQAPFSVEAAPPYPSSSGIAPSAVSVPPLQRAPALSTAPSTLSPGAGATYDADTIRQPFNTTPLPGAGISNDANTLRQPSSAANLASPLQLTPLQPPMVPSIATPTYDANTVRQASNSPTVSPVVEFGQPLPSTSDAARVSGQPLASVNQSPGVRQAFKPFAPNVLLPAGTTLSLQYPGNSALSLRTDSPQQEVLVLQTDLRDVSGNLLAPAGSLVTGRFETTPSGSQFVTQAIAVTGRSLPLAAQSETLNGTRKVTSNDLARNSGLGILAGGVLGAIGGSTGLGAIGGAAAGAAATLATSPKPAMIQPGQLIQVRLTQDLSL